MFISSFLILTPSICFSSWLHWLGIQIQYWIEVFIQRQELSLSLFQWENLQYSIIKYDVCWKFFVDKFIILRKFPSPHLLSFCHEGVEVHQILFLHLVQSWSDPIIFTPNSVNMVNYIEWFLMLNLFCSFWINITFSKYHFIYC